MPPTLLTADTNSSFHDTIQKAGALQVREMKIQTLAISLSNSVTLGANHVISLSLNFLKCVIDKLYLGKLR